MDGYHDHISESLVTMFWVKISVLQFFNAEADPEIFFTLDLESGMEKKFRSGIRDKRPGSATLTAGISIPEELSQVHVVWCLLEAKTSAVVEIHGELSRESLKHS